MSLHTDDRPDALLKSALEKIVYFEARSSQLTNDLDQATSELTRMRGDLAQASQREIELRRLVAELEVRATRSHADREEMARIAEALRRERAQLIGKMLDASRIQGADDVSSLDGLDLAQFISELRQEVLFRRPPAGGAPVAVAVAAPATTLPESHVANLAAPSTPSARLDLPPDARPTPTVAVTSVKELAKDLKREGRLDVSAVEFSALQGALNFPGRSEETLFGFSVRELSAPDGPARARAAERLKALAHPAAAPALATALHGETDDVAKVALLGALAALARSEAVAVVAPHLSGSSPDVRIAALKALLTLEPAAAGPHLAAATKDPDRTVRRRASLLALGLTGDAALALGHDAVRDADADVRSLAVLVLGASGAEAARPLLMEAMRDPDLRVRRAASQALSRALGQDVTNLVGLDDAQRRREVRRLASVEAHPVLAKAVVHAPAAKPRPVAQPPVAAAVKHTASSAVSAPARAVSRPAPAVASAAAPAARRTAVAVLEAAPAPVSAQTTASVLTELRAAMRGRPLDELAQNIGETQEAALKACTALMQQGQVVRRGLKYFVA